MNNVTIWRLVDRDGRGAFRGIPCLVDQAKEQGYRVHRCDPHQLPAPTDDRESGSELYSFCRDVPYSEGCKYYFGFISIEQYRRWFSCENLLMDIADFGGVLCEYSVPKEFVKEGFYQCLFKMSRAVKIREWSPVI